MVSRKQLRERAVELAGGDGRAPQDALKCDWEQAKHELLDEPDTSSNDEITPNDEFGQISLP